MPPRVPIVAVFVLAYFMTAIGAGASPEAAAVTLPIGALASVFSGDGLAVAGAGGIVTSVGQLLGVAAVGFAVIDAAWRPMRTNLDKIISMMVFLVLVAGVIMRPDVASASLGVIAAAAFGDMLGAARRRRSI